MELPQNIDYAKVISLARDGSPLLLGAVGRVVGLGQAEQRAITSGRVPWWTIAGLGLALGFIAGARVERKFKGRMPSAIAGE
jgi:hypothetical protein